MSTNRRGREYAFVLLMAMHAFASWSWAADITVPATRAAPRFELVNELLSTGGLTTGATVAWPAGVMTLSQVVERFNRDGNVAQISQELDASQSLSVPAFSGTWWQGIDEVCRVYAISLLAPPMAPSMGYYSQPGLRGNATPVAYGCPVFAKATPERRVLAESNGPLRLELAACELLNGMMTGTLRVRVEPRLAPLRLSVVGIQSKVGQLDFSAGNNGGVISAKVSNETKRLTAMRVHIIPSVSWKLNELLPIHDRVLLRIAKATFSAQRTAGDTVVVKASNSEGGWPQTQFTANGRSANFNSSFDQKREALSYTIANVTEATTLRMEMSGTISVGSATLEIPGFQASQMPTTLAPMQRNQDAVATRVQWPARDMTISEMVTMLGVSNPLVIGEGVDAQRRVTMPAFSGTWWNGLVLAARTCGLGIRTEGGRAVMVVPDLTQGQWTAAGAGAFLVRVERREMTSATTQFGVERRMRLTLSAQIEPRHRGLLMGAPMLRCIAKADAQQSAIVVDNRSKGTSGRSSSRSNEEVEGDESEGMSRSDAELLKSFPLWEVEIANLPPSGTALHLAIQVSAQLFLETRPSITLNSGTTASAEASRTDFLDYGTHTVAASVMSAKQFDEAFGDMARQYGMNNASTRVGMLVLIGVPGYVQQNEFKLTGADKRAIGINGSTMSGSNLMVFNLDRQPQGDCQLVTTVRRPLGSVVEACELVFPAP